MGKKTVLFDLDGTLLPMDQEVFVKAYFQGIGMKLAPHGYDPKELLKVIWAGTDAMIANDGRDTNEEVFWNFFTGRYGAEARKHEPIFADFYENEFNKVQSVCGHTPRAAELIRALKEKGVQVILATNPIFPQVATRARVRWAGLSWEDFAYVTTYENCRYCKPNVKYYEEILDRLGLDPKDCCMVGNDAGDDLPAAELGMEVFLLTDNLINKAGTDISAIPQGGFDELFAFLFED